MKNIFTEKGEFSVSIGKGYISAFEASVLKEGDILRSDQIAGNGMTASFNGEFLCRGQIAIIDDLFCFRVTETEQPVSRPEVLSNTDDIVEMLPFEMRLAGISLSIEQLKGISCGSIINLDKKYGTDEDVELYVAGQPFAIGRTSVVGENMAIRITGIFGHNYREDNVRTSGYIINENRDRVKDYNYTMPDWFTKESLENIGIVHDLFLKNLKIRVPELSGLKVRHVDQCTFQEAIEWLENTISLKECSLLYIGQTTWSHRGEDLQSSRASRFSRTGKHMLEADNSKNRLSGSAIKAIDSYFETNTKGIYLERPVFITVPNTESMQKLISTSSELQYFSSCLRSGWKKFSDFSFSEMKVYPSPDGPAGNLKHDMVAVAAARDDKENFIYFIYPLFTLEPILKIIS